MKAILRRGCRIQHVRGPSLAQYVRDAQRVIEAVETLVRIHTAQEEDIYEAVVAR